MNTPTDELYFGFCYKSLIIILLLYISLVGILNNIILHLSLMDFISDFLFYMWPPNAYAGINAESSILSESQVSEFFFDRSILSILLLMWSAFCLFYKISSRRNLFSLPLLMFTLILSVALYICAMDGIHQKSDLVTLGSRDNLFVLVAKSMIFIFGFYFSLHFTLYLVCSASIRAFRKLV